MGQTRRNRRERRTAHVIGLISDTHGLVRADVHRALAGVELILHAGDVGGDEVLDELELIAPVHAVYGNTDRAGRSATARGDRADDRRRAHPREPRPRGRKPDAGASCSARYPADVIVYGHTHQQLVVARRGALVVNPGAAGARRFELEPSVARLTITNGAAEVELVSLGD